MEDLSVVPDDLLEEIKKVDPEFPLCTVDCITWKLEHPDCRGCKHFTRCKDVVMGMEIGAARALKRFEFRFGL